MDINTLLFPDFETLDAFGAVEVLGRVEEYHLRYFSIGGGTVVSSQGVKIDTEPLKDSDDSGVLLIPGGQGARPLLDDADFIRTLTDVAEHSKYCLTVCTGSVLLAKTGLLDDRSATSNKRAMEWVKSTFPNVNWLCHARWVTDGKIYTSSGISSGIDMALGFISDRFGREKAADVAESIEYIWSVNKNSDPFSLS